MRRDKLDPAGGRRRVGDVGGGDVANEGGDAGRDATGDAPNDARDATSSDSSASDTTTIDTGVIDSGVDTTIDDTGVGVDTAPIDTGTLDTGPPCVPGTPCASGDPCKTAAITCTAGGPLCAITGKVADGTGCGPGMVCSGGACIPCAAGSSCTASGPCKTATIDCSSGAFVCTGGVCVASSVTVNFPTSSDPWSTAVGVYYFWNAGDWLQGSRTTTLPSATHVTIHINAMYNGLTCDNQDMRMLINGVEVGRFSNTPGIATLDTSFTFAVATGPTYTLRYDTVRTVAGGCGAASFGPSGSPTPTGSTVTLSP